MRPISCTAQNDCQAENSSWCCTVYTVYAAQCRGDVRRPCSSLGRDYKARPFVQSSQPDAGNLASGRLSKLSYPCTSPAKLNVVTHRRLVSTLFQHQTIAGVGSAPRFYSIRTFGEVSSIELMTESHVWTDKRCSAGARARLRPRLDRLDMLNLMTQRSKTQIARDDTQST